MPDMLYFHAIQNALYSSSDLKSTTYRNKRRSLTYPSSCTNSSLHGDPRTYAIVFHSSLQLVFPILICVQKVPKNFIFKSVFSKILNAKLAKENIALS